MITCLWWSILIIHSTNRCIFKPLFPSWVTLVFDFCSEATTTRSMKRYRCSFRALRNPTTRAILWNWFVRTWRRLYAEVNCVTVQWGGGWCVISGKAMDKAIRYISSTYSCVWIPWFRTIRGIAVLCMTTKRAKRLSCSDLLLCQSRRRSVIQRRSMQRSGSMRCYTMNESRVDMKVHQNTMDPVLFDFVRKVLSFPPSHCRLLPTSTRHLPACRQWSCAFVLFLQLSVEVCHYRLRTAIPRDRFSEGNQLVAGRAGRSDSVGDGKGNKLSHLAHASGHQGVFRLGWWRTSITSVPASRRCCLVSSREL